MRALDTQVPSALSISQEIRPEQINLGDALCVILFNREVPRRFDVSLVCAFKHTTAIQCFQFSPDGNLIAIVCFESVAILDCQTGNKVAVIHEEEPNLVTTPAVQICFTPDGRHLVGLTQDRIKTWDIETGDTRIVNVDLGKGRIRVISEDGTMLVTSHDDVRKVWDLNLRDCPSIQQRTLLVREFKVHDFAISPDKKFVAGGGPRGKVFVWETESGAVVLDSEICQERVDSLKFSSKGGRLLVGSYSGTVRLLEFATAKGEKDRDPDLRAHSTNPVRTFPPSVERQDWVYSVCWSGDDKYVLAGYSHGSICVWNSDMVPEFILGRSQNASGIDISRSLSKLCLVDRLISTVSIGGDYLFATSSSVSGDCKVRVWKYGNI
jgi:WD40 repeat protein